MFSNNSINIGFLILPLISGVGYYLYFLTKNREINEVIWTNQFSQNCKFSREEHLSNKSLCKRNNCSINSIQKLVHLIENANYSIDLAMHIFTLKEISNAIARVHKKGVRVRIICCDLQKGSSGSKVWQLSDADIPIRFQKSNGDELMHHKFCIIDGKNRIKELVEKDNLKNKVSPNSLLLTGSCNWTLQGLNVNWENIIITSNKILLDSFEKEFEKMWFNFKR